MLPPAARLIEKASRFQNGSCWHDFSGRPCGPGDADTYDAVGAIFTAYAGTEPENRHLAAKRAFDLCRARYGHARLGHLGWEEAFEILRDADA